LILAIGDQDIYINAKVCFYGFEFLKVASGDRPTHPIFNRMLGKVLYRLLTDKSGCSVKYNIIGAMNHLKNARDMAMIIKGLTGATSYAVLSHL
jgi:hypothetical protein